MQPVNQTMKETEYRQIRTTHPRWHIEDITPNEDGWLVEMVDKDYDEPFDYQADDRDFEKWMAENIFGGEERAARIYITAEPEWAIEYLKEYVFSKL